MTDKRRYAVREVVFATGDLLLLIGSTTIAARTAAAAHQFIGSFVIAALVGMTLAMAVQMVIAALSAVLLGSIETMVPSMVGGMLATALICLGGLVMPIPHMHAVWLGAGTGVVTFAGLALYGRRCAARFARGGW